MIGLQTVLARAVKKISTIFDHRDAAFSDDYLGGLLVPPA
jgi:hypothetical protein